MEINLAEIKTPLLRSKKCKKVKKSKKANEELKIEEFMSYGSGNFFNIQDEDDQDMPEDLNMQRSSLLAERSIEDWLSSRSIFKSPISAKKEEFFEEKRDRVNSISYFEYLAETGSTDISPINNSKGITPPSLSLTPGNSKIYKKRSNFASMADIQMNSMVNQGPSKKVPTRMCISKQNQVQSDQKVKIIAEDIECIDEQTTFGLQKKVPLRFNSDL